jgi:hypothetical protein
MGKSGNSIMAKISKNICGVYVYGYPCWESTTDYTQDTNLIIEYGEYFYFNEKRIDITFDNTTYIHGLQPPNNPIFRLKERVWKSVGATTSAVYEVGQRLVTTNPNTSDLVHFVSKGRGTASPYTGLIFNSDYYYPLWGETDNFCSIFNPVSCASWENDDDPSVGTSSNIQTIDTQIEVESMSFGTIDIEKSVQNRQVNQTPWDKSF